MIIDAKQLFSEHASLTGEREIGFPGGSVTLLTPVHYTPRPERPERTVSLDGAWQCLRWPFSALEEILVSGSESGWETLAQPGKVFYADPDADPAAIPGWNRVTLAHIKDEDGAIIKRRAYLPASWKNKRIILRFDAIFPAGRIYCNEKLIGTHASGLTPVEYDVTDLVSAGSEVRVAVRLLRKHRFIQLDMPRHALEFAGLAQSAYFFAVNECHIHEHHLVAELDASLARGTISGAVTIRNAAKRSLSATVIALLLDNKGQTVASTESTLTLGGNETKDALLTLTLNSPLLWNDEYPNLYTVKIHLVVAGAEDEIISYRTGFRRFDLSPEGARLNGNPVKFRGVNHLTFHPEHGMHTTRECLTLMKKANVNAIRTHFLGPRDLADLCDELGIYLLQELPIDWGTHFIHDPAWVGPALMRIEGGIKRDRHHPSVMVWSVGNENMPESAKVAEDGWNHLRIFDEFAKRLDPSRPTMFPPPGPANKIEGSFKVAREFRRTGVAVNPRSWEADMEQVTHVEAVRRGWSGVWFSSEYGAVNMMPDLMNAPYLSCIADKPEDILSYKNSLQTFIDRMRDEWGDMRRDPTCLGGAYFPWMCSGAGKGPEGNPWGWVRWAEDADWGVVTADLLPKPFFWALRVLFSPVWFPERVEWEEGANDLRFKIANHYNAVNLKECTLRTMMAGGGIWMGSMWDAMNWFHGMGGWRYCFFSGAGWTPSSTRMRLTVECPMVWPSFFSSPTILRYPQSRFSFPSRTTRHRSSWLKRGLPDFFGCFPLFALFTQRL
jgi:hypothetical protein